MDLLNILKSAAGICIVVCLLMVWVIALDVSKKSKFKLSLTTYKLAAVVFAGTFVAAIVFCVMVIALSIT